MYILYKNIAYLMNIFMCAYNIISILWACVREGKYIHYTYMCVCVCISVSYSYSYFFPAHKHFAKKQWKGLGARRIF